MTSLSSIYDYGKNALASITNRFSDKKKDEDSINKTIHTYTGAGKNNFKIPDSNKIVWKQESNDFDVSGSGIFNIGTMYGDNPTQVPPNSFDEKNVAKLTKDNQNYFDTAYLNHGKTYEMKGNGQILNYLSGGSMIDNDTVHISGKNATVSFYGNNHLNVIGDSPDASAQIINNDNGDVTVSGQGKVTAHNVANGKISGSIKGTATCNGRHNSCNIAQTT